MEILIRDTPEKGARVASRLVKKILSSRSNPVLGLATGDTPLRLYREMIRMYQAGELSFQDCTSFNLDEYVGLPPEDERSYHHYMRTHLFDQVDMDPEHIHLPNACADDLRQACRDYEQKIKESGGIDLQVLGIGANGHIGFKRTYRFTGFQDLGQDS